MWAATSIVTTVLFALVGIVHATLLHLRSQGTWPPHQGQAPDHGASVPPAPTRLARAQEHLRRAPQGGRERASRPIGQPVGESPCKLRAHQRRALKRSALITVLLFVLVVTAGALLGATIPLGSSVPEPVASIDHGATVSTNVAPLAIGQIAPEPGGIWFEGTDPRLVCTSSSAPTSADMAVGGQSPLGVPIQGQQGHPYTITRAIGPASGLDQVAVTMHWADGRVADVEWPVSPALASILDWRAHSVGVGRSVEHDQGRSVLRLSDTPENDPVLLGSVPDAVRGAWQMAIDMRAETLQCGAVLNVGPLTLDLVPAGSYVLKYNGHRVSSGFIGVPLWSERACSLRLIWGHGIIRVTLGATLVAWEPLDGVTQIGGPVTLGPVRGTLRLSRYGIASAPASCPAECEVGLAGGLSAKRGCGARLVSATWNVPQDGLWRPGETIEAELPASVSPEMRPPWGTLGGAPLPPSRLSLRGRTVACALPPGLPPGLHDLRIYGEDGRRVWMVETEIALGDRGPGCVVLDRTKKLSAGWGVSDDGKGLRLMPPAGRHSSVRADLFLAGDCDARLVFVPMGVGGTLALRVNSFCEAQIDMDRGHGFLRLERNERQAARTAYVLGEAQLSEPLRPDTEYFLHFTRCGRVWTAEVGLEDEGRLIASFVGRADQGVRSDCRVVEYGGWGEVDIEFRKLDLQAAVPEPIVGSAEPLDRLSSWGG